jgi:hypothetical protein
MTYIVHTNTSVFKLIFDLDQGNISETIHFASTSIGSALESPADPLSGFFSFRHMRVEKTGYVLVNRGGFLALK